MPVGQGGLEVADATDGARIQALVDALHQTGQHLAGPAFGHLGHAVRHQRLHAGRPLHRQIQLLHERLPDGVDLGALSDAETSLTRFGNQRRNLFSSVASRNGAKQSATYAGQRYAQGAIPLTTFIDAERTALAADQSVLEATGELDRAFVALQKAMGLGWSQRPWPRR